MCVGGSVGRAVAYDARGPGYKSCHRQVINEYFLNCIKKTNVNKKRPGMAHLKKSTDNGRKRELERVRP